MATDFFGYSRDIKPNGQVATSEFATLRLKGGKLGLVQTVQAAYGQTINAKFEAGSPTLYWVTGQPQGTITFGRLVGRGGLMSDLSSLQNSCGEVIAVTIGLDGEGACKSAGSNFGGSMSFSGGVVENINVSFQSGLLEVAEGATIRVASMTL